MDYMSIGTMIGASLGVISFIMYFPLKRKEIRAKTDNENVEALSNVVHGLQEELERKNAQLNILDKRVSTLEEERRNDDLAFSAITACAWYKKGGECPIIDRKNESKKEKRSTEICSKKENGCKKGRDLHRK